MSRVLRLCALFAMPLVAVVGTRVLARPELLFDSVLWLIACTILLPLPFGVALGVLLDMRSAMLAALGYGALITLLYAIPLPPDLELADLAFTLEPGLAAFLLSWFFAWAVGSVWSRWQTRRVQNPPVPPANKRIEQGASGTL